MKITTLVGKSLGMLRQHPYIWLLALLAVVSDVEAVLSYDPSRLDLPSLFLLTSAVSLLAEVGLLYAFIQHAQGKKNTLTDSFMMSIASLPRVLPIKAAILIVPALFFLITFLLVGVGFLHIALIGIAGVLVFLLLTLTQIWTVFALCGSFVQEYSAGEAISHGWHILWGHKKQLLKIALPFVVIDLLLISLLIAAGSVSYDSAFIYEITEEMALSNQRLAETRQSVTAASPIQEGQYFRVNRILNGFGSAMLKARGAELLSIPMHFVDRVAAGLIAVVVGMLLVPLRISVWALAYQELAEPVLEFRNVIGELRLERAAAATADENGLPLSQPAYSTATQGASAWTSERVRIKYRWILAGIASPLIAGVVMLGLCWTLKTWQVWLFSQPWKSGPLAGCPNWLPVDSRKPQILDSAGMNQQVFCALEYDHVACQGQVLQVSEPVTREIPFVRQPECTDQFPVKVTVLAGQGTVRVSILDLQGVTAPLEVTEGETATITGIAAGTRYFTLLFEPVGGDAQKVCFGSRIELDCPAP